MPAKGDVVGPMVPAVVGKQMTFDIAKLLWTYDPKTGLFIWNVSPKCDIEIGSFAGGISAGGYRYLTFRGRKFRASRVAWLLMTGRWPHFEIDHIDCNQNNDKLDNLREATRQQNVCNVRTRKDNKLGIKGVFYRRGSYHCAISVNGKKKHIGCFQTKEGAKAAYEAAAIEAHGEFRRVA